jgi:hypothetical protein
MFEDDEPMDAPESMPEGLVDELRAALASRRSRFYSSDEASEGEDVISPIGASRTEGTWTAILERPRALRGAGAKPSGAPRQSTALSAVPVVSAAEAEAAAREAVAVLEAVLRTAIAAPPPVGCPQPYELRLPTVDEAELLSKSSTPATVKAFSPIFSPTRFARRIMSPSAASPPVGTPPRTPAPVKAAPRPSSGGNGSLLNLVRPRFLLALVALVGFGFLW